MMSIDFAAIAFAVYMPFYTKTRPDQAFFFLDEQVPYLLTCSLILLSYSAFGVLKLLFISMLMYASRDDTTDSAAAEASMKLSRISAVAASAICFFSFVLVMRTYQLWAAALERLTR